MKIQTSIICAVLAFGIVAPTGAEDCYKQLMYSLCTGPGTVLNWGDLCRTWTDKGYTCDEQPSLEQNVTSYLPDPARLKDSFTLIIRGCRWYKICLKTGQPPATCWGPEGKTDNTFVSGSCPQGE
jgi:hypothetical protein